MDAPDDAVQVIIESSWIVSQGSLDSCVSVVFLDPVSREPIIPSSPRPTQRLVLIPPLDSRPCEITVKFQKRLCHVENFYILSTARICELYSRSKLTADPEYICTVKGWLPEDPQSPSQNREIENTACVRPTSPTAVVNTTMALSPGNDSDNIEDTAGEDNWVEVKPNGSSNGYNRSTAEIESISDDQQIDANNHKLCKIDNGGKCEIDSYGENDSMEAYEAELELLDQSPWESLTVRLLSLQVKTRVEIDQVVFLALSGPAISDPTLLDPLAQKGKNSELLTMFLPSMLQMAQRFTKAQFSDDSLKSNANQGLVRSEGLAESYRSATEYKSGSESNNDRQKTQMEQSKGERKEITENEIKLSAINVNNVQHQYDSFLTENSNRSLSKNILSTLQEFSARFDRLESLCLRIESYLQQAVESIDQRVTILEEKQRETFKRIPEFYSSLLVERQGQLSPKAALDAATCCSAMSADSAPHGFTSVSTEIFGEPSADTTMAGSHTEIFEEPSAGTTMAGSHTEIFEEPSAGTTMAGSHTEIFEESSAGTTMAGSHTEIFGEPSAGTTMAGSHTEIFEEPSAGTMMAGSHTEIFGEPSAGTTMAGSHTEAEEPCSSIAELDTLHGNDCRNDSQSQINEDYAEAMSFRDSGSAISVQCDPLKKLNDAWMTSLSAFTLSYSPKNSERLGQSIITGNISLSNPEDCEVKNVLPAHIDHKIGFESECTTNDMGLSIRSDYDTSSQCSADSEKMKQCVDGISAPCEGNVDACMSLKQPSHVNIFVDETAESMSSISDQPSQVTGLTVTRNRDYAAADVDSNLKSHEDCILPSINDQVKAYGSPTSTYEAGITSCFQADTISSKVDPAMSKTYEQDLQIIDDYIVNMEYDKSISSIPMSVKQNKETSTNNNESDDTVKHEHSFN